MHIYLYRCGWNQHNGGTLVCLFPTGKSPAKALLGLSRAESRYGFNPVGQTTARRRKTHKPGGTENCVQECTQTSTYVKQRPALVDKTQCWIKNEAYKLRCR
eukprot:14864255-Ditylum_brightwellii.AAC.1